MTAARWMIWSRLHPSPGPDALTLGVLRELSLRHTVLFWDIAESEAGTPNRSVRCFPTAKFFRLSY